MKLLCGCWAFVFLRLFMSSVLQASGKSVLAPATKKMLQSLKFSFIGLGMMGSHFLAPLLKEKIILPENVIGTQHKFVARCIISVSYRL